MKIQTEPYKHGLRMITLSCEVDGEASGRMLVEATEAIKTACAGGLDAAAKRHFLDGITDKKAKAEKAKTLTREVMFGDDKAVAVAFARFKPTDHHKNVVITDAGAWSGGDSSKTVAAQAQYELMLPLVGAETALKVARLVVPGFTPASAEVVKPEVPSTPEGEPESAN
jgi:hypothetical protein